MGGEIIQADETTRTIGFAQEDAGNAETSSPEDHMLMVDDEAAILRILPRTVKRDFPGVKIDTALNGREGLEKAQALSDDLHSRLIAVVSDMIMPEMTGIELYRKLREIPGFEDLPVVWVSGYTGKDFPEVQEALDGRDPFLRYLQKPFEGQKLIQHLQELIALRAERRAAQSETASALTDSPDSGLAD
ncbi:MAG: response regulator [Candidatus Gracilibacteria bacterium]